MKRFFSFGIVFSSIFGPVMAVECPLDSGVSQAGSHILSTNEKINGKHVAADMHIHAFNHNEKNDPQVHKNVVSQEALFEQDMSMYLRHITRRTREGGYKCSFNMFTEHFGFNIVNRDPMINNVEKLSTQIKNDSDYMEKECSFFANAWEFTPKASLSPHVLVLFADNQSFIKSKKNKNFYAKELYKQVLKNSTDDDLKFQSNSIKDSLFALAHPMRNVLENSKLAKKKIFSGKDATLLTINDFKKVLIKKYGLEKSNINSKIKERFVGIEFPRALDRRGLPFDNTVGVKEKDKIKAIDFIDLFQSTEKLYQSMLALDYHLMPMLNGDRHNSEKLEKPLDGSIPGPVNLTLLGPRIALSKEELLGILEEKNISLAQAKECNINEIIKDEIFQDAFNGNTRLLVTDVSKLSEEAFYDTILNRQGYITYKRNLKITTKAIQGESFKHMGSKLKFTGIDKINIELDDDENQLLIGDDLTSVKCPKDIYKVYAVYSKFSNLENHLNDDLNSLIIEEELTASSSCDKFSFILNETAQRSPFLYFKVRINDSHPIFELLVKDRSKLSLAGLAPAALSAAYINTSSEEDFTSEDTSAEEDDIADDDISEENDSEDDASEASSDDNASDDDSSENQDTDEENQDDISDEDISEEPEVPEPIINEAPIITQALPNLELEVASTIELDLNEFFQDPESLPLIYSVNNSNINAVAHSLNNAKLSLLANNIGSASLIVTAIDFEALRANSSFSINVKKSSEQIEAENIAELDQLLDDIGSDIVFSIQSMNAAQTELLKPINNSNIADSGITDQLQRAANQINDAKEHRSQPSLREDDFNKASLRLSTAEDQINFIKNNIDNTTNAVSRSFSNIDKALDLVELLKSSSNSNLKTFLNQIESTLKSVDTDLVPIFHNLAGLPGQIKGITENINEVKIEIEIEISDLAKLRQELSGFDSLEKNLLATKTRLTKISKGKGESIIQQLHALPGLNSNFAGLKKFID